MRPHLAPLRHPVRHTSIHAVLVRSRGHVHDLLVGLHDPHDRQPRLLHHPADVRLPTAGRDDPYLLRHDPDQRA